MSARSDARCGDQDYAHTMWAATQQAEEIRAKLQYQDDQEEQHDCEPDAPWANWFWLSVLMVVVSSVSALILLPWVAGKVIP